jgi:hypothetical protein
MLPAASRDRLVLLAIGFIVLIGPALILVAALGVLILLGDLQLDQITLLVFLELYLIELILFVGFAYGLYRLMLWLVLHQAPQSLDALQFDDKAGSPGESSEPGDDS